VDHRFSRSQPRRAAPPARGAQKRPAPAGRGLLFHAPSFAVGLMLGAAIVLTTAYLPEYLAQSEPAPLAAQPGPRPTQPEPRPLTFEFDTLLRSGSAPILPDPATATPAPAPELAPLAEVAASAPVTIDPAPAQPIRAEPIPAEPIRAEPELDLPPVHVSTPTVISAGGETYLLQAASFRARADADRLRAELLLLDLPATTGEITLGGALWYRVTVGPYGDPQAAEQAMARLRERNLAPILVRR